MSTERCTRCALPETFPGISFGADGQCSVCADGEEQGTFSGEPERLRSSLIERIEAGRAAAREHGRSHDAVVAFSGGKDSSYLIYLLQQRFGLRLLAVTLDNGFLSDASSANMRAVVEALNVDHLTARYRHDHLCAIFLTSARTDVYPEHLTRFGSSVCISCIRMVMTAALRTALEKQIPMVMLGNSPGQMLRSREELIYQDNKIPFGLRRALFSRLARKLGPWVNGYLMLSEQEYRAEPFPYLISPLPILGYDEAEIYRTIAGLGWSRPSDVDPSSTNCRLNSFGIAHHLRRHGFHPYDFELSELIRVGAMTREAALERLDDSDGQVARVAAEVELELDASCHRESGS